MAANHTLRGHQNQTLLQGVLPLFNQNIKLEQQKGGEQEDEGEGEERGRGRGGMDRRGTRKTSLSSSSSSWAQHISALA